MSEALTTRILAMAKKAGFDAAGIAPASLPESVREKLLRFLKLGRHGTMGWMETRAEQRAQPQTLWPEAKSIIMLGMNYAPDKDPLSALSDTSNGAISVYAQNRDYHDVVKKRLKRIAREIVEKTGAEVKVFVDTAPVMEKPLAAQAGIGWQGKHTNLVSREFGSWLFLGAIFTTLDLTQDKPESDHCGSCNNCLDICPTNAFPAPYQLDAQRCISYLTIEHPGPIPRAFRKPMGNRIYGCDDCLAVCPWNKFADRAKEAAFHARDDLHSPALRDLASLNDTAFRALFSGSPVKRTGRDRFVRNVMIAIGNSGDDSLVETVLERIHDDSAVVRGAAVWALSQLAPQKIEALRSKHLAKETDETVCAEWLAA